MHERNEGGDHHGQALPRILSGNGGNLIAQTFAAPRGHEHQGILTRCDVLNDVLLGAAERLVAKDFTQDAQNLGVRVGNRDGHGKYCPPCREGGRCNGERTKRHCKDLSVLASRRRP